MTYDTYHGAEPHGELESEETAPLYKTLFKLLRGRWHWAILLAILLGGSGLYLGYHAQEDLYTGVSLVELKPSINVAVEFEDLSLNESYQNFVRSQMRKLTSLEVVSSAMDKPDWIEAVSARPAGLAPITVESFVGRITITEPERKETVMTVEFTDEDPKTAQAGMEALLAAYRDSHKQSQSDEIDDNLRLLNEQLLALESDKAITERQISLIIPNDESATIEARLTSKLRELGLMEARLSEVVVTLQPYLDAVANPENATEILATSPEMEALLLEKQKLDEDYVYLTEVLGRGEEMPDVQNVRRNQIMVQRRIDQLENKLAASPDDGSLDPNTLPQGIAELVGTRDMLVKKIDELKAQTSDLGSRIKAAQDYEAKLGDIALSIRETNDKIKKYKATLDFSQNDVTSRIVFETPVPTPTKPSNTLRRYQLAGLGTVFGMSIGFGFIMLIGAMDRKVRHASDTVSGVPDAKVLGVLPTLPADLNDPEDAEAVAHCVHHIRALLQIGGSNRVFSITSPTAGSGKSSLATALGMSFATSDVRTLVIDADLVGAGLSRRMGTIVHEPLDVVIRRNEMMDEAELARATTLAASRQQPLDHVLLEENLMDTEQIESAFRLQKDTSLSLLDAAHPGKLRSCIASTEMENFFILPVGNAKPSDASKLSPALMRELIRQAREAFDIVLIDTGPILGSLEASIAAAESDSTILIVSRGDQKSLVTRSLEQLRAVRAQIAGLVFNHAVGSDLDHVSYASLVSQERRPDRKTRQKALDKNRSSRLGPLGTAVASYTDE